MLAFRLPYEPGQLFACGARAAAHVGRSLTRRKPYTSDILQLKQEMLLSTSDQPFADGKGLHVGLSIFSFQVVLLTSGNSPTSCALPLAPGLPNQLIRAAKAAAKRRYFYQKSCLLPHFFAAFGNFQIFYLKTATEKHLSPQNCCALGPRAFFYN